MQRKPIGNREEYDSSLAFNIPRRWINYRKGTPGETINVKKLEYKLNVIGPALPVPARFFHRRQILTTNICLTGAYRPKGTGVMQHPQRY